MAIAALNLAPSRRLAAGVGQGEASVPLSALSPDGNSIKVSTLDYAAAVDASGNAATASAGLGAGDCATAMASANGATGPAKLSYVTGGVDTAALYARFTFAEWAAPRTHFYDYSGNGNHANITSGVVATEDQDGAATEAAAFTAGYPATAVSPAKAAAVVSVPTPPLTKAGEAFTLCSWARALGHDGHEVGAASVNPAAPLAGSWVFACVVTKAVVGTAHAAVTAAVTSVRINGAAAPTEAAFDAYGALGPVYGDAAGETGSVAEATVWARELATCEMDALYYTDGFAIDAGKIAAHPSGSKAPIPSGISATLALPAGGRGTFAMWIKPGAAAVTSGARQTLLAGYLPDTLGSMFNAPVFDLALVGELLVFTVRRFPAAAPGSGMATSNATTATKAADAMTGGVCGGSVALEVTSPAAAVAGGKWAHVAATFDGEYATLLVDGVVVGVSRGPEAFRDQAGAGETPAVPAAMYTLAVPFDGLIFDLRVADPPLAAWEVKRDVQCPPLHVSGDVAAASAHGGVYLRFNEGAGTVAGHGAVSGIPAGAWVNASSPAALMREAAPSRLTTLGVAEPPAYTSTSFILQQRGACGARLRGHGAGAGVTATFSPVGVNGASIFNSTGGFLGYEPVLRVLPVESLGEGADSIEFTPGPDLLNFVGLTLYECGQEYAMVAAVGGAPVVNLRVKFPSGDIDAALSSASLMPAEWLVDAALADNKVPPEAVVGDDIELGCFGAPTVITIRTVDATGCVRLGDTSHVFSAKLTGPGDAAATSTPMGDGVYSISIVPPAGAYTRSHFSST